MASQRRSTISRHLNLMCHSDSLQDTEQPSEGLSDLRLAPFFSSRVRNVVKEANVFPQYGFLGIQQINPNQNVIDGNKSEAVEERDRLVYYNTNTPSSAFICGSQGAGKSHTLSCLLENSLLSPSDAGILPNPLAGMVFHYDKFTSHSSSQLCEAAYLCSQGIPVRVLVSPTNIWSLEKFYKNLPGLPEGAPKPEVLPLRFRENQLNAGNLKTLMAVKDGAQTPLYLAVLNQLLRDIVSERCGKPGIDYKEFKKRLDQQGFTESQRVPLNMRLQLVESFLEIAPSAKAMSAPNIVDVWKFEEGSLTIIDLSCPFVSENEACALFGICLELFLANRGEGGRIVALDEAHKFLTKSGEAEAFTNQLLSTIRQQRHLATRILISTQEPTILPSLIDLCSVTIIHRFLSPAWFDVLQDHLAGAARKSPAARDQLFRTIVGLGTGEALLFSPTSVLDVSFADDDERTPTFKALSASYIKLRMRNRLTADGGKSIMASDRELRVDSSEDSKVVKVIRRKAFRWPN